MPEANTAKYAERAVTATGKNERSVEKRNENATCAAKAPVMQILFG